MPLDSKLIYFLIMYILHYLNYFIGILESNLCVVKNKAILVKI